MNVSDRAGTSCALRMEAFVSSRHARPVLHAPSRHAQRHRLSLAGSCPSCSWWPFPALLCAPPVRVLCRLPPPRRLLQPTRPPRRRRTALPPSRVVLPLRRCVRDRVGMRCRRGADRDCSSPPLLARVGVRYSVCVAWWLRGCNFVVRACICMPEGVDMCMPAYVVCVFGMCVGTGVCVDVVVDVCVACV